MSQKVCKRSASASRWVQLHRPARFNPNSELVADGHFRCHLLLRFLVERVSSNARRSREDESLLARPRLVQLLSVSTFRASQSRADVNLADFILDAYHGILFTIHYILRRPGTRASHQSGLDIDRAFAGKLNESEERLTPSPVDRWTTRDEQMLFNSNSKSSTINHFPLPPAMTTYGRHEDPYSSLRGRRYSQDAGVEEMSQFGDERERMGNQNWVGNGVGETTGSRGRPESSQSAYGQISYGTAQ